MQLHAAPPIFPTPPFPFPGLLPAFASVPNCHSNPIAQRVRRRRQRLPPSLLIENASDSVLHPSRHLCPEAFPIKASDHPPGISVSLQVENKYFIGNGHLIGSSLR